MSLIFSKKTKNRKFVQFPDWPQMGGFVLQLYSGTGGSEGRFLVLEGDLGSI